MLYNIEKRNTRNVLDCLTCRFFDKKYKRCQGIGKVCFEYDAKTMTIIDPVTHLPLKK